jgi:hypothetical protein
VSTERNHETSKTKSTRLKRRNITLRPQNMYILQSNTDVLCKKCTKSLADEHTDIISPQSTRPLIMPATNRSQNNMVRALCACFVLRCSLKGQPRFPVLCGFPLFCWTRNMPQLPETLVSSYYEVFRIDRFGVFHCYSLF